MASRTRIAVVDDHPLLRDGVIHVLQSASDIDVVATGATAEHAVQIATGDLPDVMLLDLRMPGNVLQSIGEMLCASPKMKVIVLTASDDTRDVVAAIQAGARGYIVKDSDAAQLVQGIKAVMDGQIHITPKLASSALRNQADLSSEGHIACSLAKLSQREHRVLREIASGKKNREIAQGLELSESTVKHYALTLMRKLRVRSRLGLALAANKLPSDVVPPDLRPLSMAECPSAGVAGVGVCGLQGADCRCGSAGNGLCQRSRHRAN